MNITITGSSGFVGHHLKNFLELNGHDVTPIDRKDGKGIHDFKIGNADFVIHLAADADVRRSIEHPDEYWHNNITPTTEIQRQCHFNNVPLLYASSSCIHNWHKSPYGISKKVNEETAFPGQVGLRFTTVYGDGARDTMFIGKLMRGELEYATHHLRDFIHVNDVIRAIELIMLKVLSPHLFPGVPLRDTYDIGTGTSNVVLDLARMKYPMIEVFEGYDCEALNNTADNTYIKELGWEPTVNVRDYIEGKYT